MNYVYICDNDSEWLEKIEKYVFRYQMQSRWMLEVACAADSPAVLLQHLTENRPSSGIYFLDIDFKSSMNSLKLGAEIQKLDPNAILIFVTTHDELAIETMRYRLMALDYILKDLPDVEGQVCKALRGTDRHTQGLYPHGQRNLRHFLLPVRAVGESRGRFHHVPQELSGKFQPHKKTEAGKQGDFTGQRRIPALLRPGMEPAHKRFLQIAPNNLLQG